MKKSLTIIVVFMLAVVAYFVPVNIVKAENNSGDYSIEYLIKNYGVITFGKQNNDLSLFNTYNYPSFVKGDLYDLNVEGAVLVNGNYNADSNYSVTFGNKAGEVQSFIKGNKGGNVTTSSTISSSSNYANFDDIYLRVVSEQKKLIEDTSKNIMGPDLIITSPGIYTINNSATYESEVNSEYNGTIYSGPNRLLIKNYNKNDIYVFNFYDEYSSCGYNILLSSSNSPTTMTLGQLVETGEYTGNIIFNFPKAKFVYCYYDISTPNIVAPKADVFISGDAYGSIFANSVYGYNNRVVKKVGYSSNKKIVEGEICDYLDEYKDYSDDLYSGSYSLRELLQNYSVVTLGNKTLDNKTQLAQKGLTPGSISLFHAAGPVLISGALDGENNNTFQSRPHLRLDLESNEATVSYIKGNILTSYYQNSYYPSYMIQSWDNVTQSRFYYSGRKNVLILGENNNLNYSYYGLLGNYINFDRLYNKIVAQQAKIEDGTKVTSKDGVANIKIGGNYVIDDVSNINEIKFESFDENKDVITVVTIKNSGDINFPLISKDTGPYKGIVTNDYYNKTEVTHGYEINKLVTDSYHGNIIWNLPNATYVKLKGNAPFAGHLIAPKADVEIPEIHFAGCFIVNSLFAEGNTEAHFYPLTAYDNCECSSVENVSNKLRLRIDEMRLDKLLGADDSIIEKNILGNQSQYNSDVATLNKIINDCPRNRNTIVQILTNPKTYSTIGIVLGVIVIAFIGYKIINNKKRQLNDDVTHLVDTY